MELWNHSHLQPMGFERSRAVKMKASPMLIGAHYRYLSDYAELSYSGLLGDDDAEHTPWPDNVIDQTKLARFCREFDFEDAEEDDWPGGDICDEPHDAREEDGI